MGRIAGPKIRVAELEIRGAAIKACECATVVVESGLERLAITHTANIVREDGVAAVEFKGMPMLGKVMFAAMMTPPRVLAAMMQTGGLSAAMMEASRSAGMSAKRMSEAVMTRCR